VLKKLLLAVVVVLAVFAVFVATRPSSYRVSRAQAIAAPPSSVYALVADFHQWDKWSPWAKLDPAMKTTYGGPVAVAGSSYAWSGNDKVGEGRMTIVEAKPGERVRIRLEFIKPFASTSSTEFEFRAEGRRDADHLDDGGPQRVRGEGVLRVHEHGQDDRERLREGPVAAQGGRRGGGPGGRGGALKPHAC